MAWRQFGEAFSALDLRLWALALVAFVLAQLISSLRWQMLAAPLGFAAPYRRYASLYFVGMFFNLVLPTSVGGDVVRAWYLGVDGKRVAAFCTVLAERASGLIVLMILACVASVFLPTSPPRWMLLVLASIAAGLVVGLPALVVVHQYCRRRRLGGRFRPLVE